MKIYKNVFEGFQFYHFEFSLNEHEIAALCQNARKRMDLNNKGKYILAMIQTFQTSSQTPVKPTSMYFSPYTHCSWTVAVQDINLYWVVVLTYLLWD